MLLLKNNAYSILGAAIAAIDTTMSVQTGHGDRFPVVTAPDYCLVTLQDASNNIEVVKVTARTAGSDSMTIQRAQDGTAARAWSLGDVVEIRLPAGAVAPLQVMEGAATASGIRTKLGATATGSALFTAADEAAARSAIGATTTGQAVMTAADAAAARAALNVPATEGTILNATNAARLTGSWAAIPAGTKMLFQQTAAPTGWTKDTTHDNKALRVVSGAAASGGSMGFDAAFASARGLSGTVGSTTLTTTQIPSHTHSYNITDDAVGGTFGGSGAGSKSATTGAAGGGGSHTHSLTMNNLQMDVAYVDIIIAAKD